VRKKGSISMSTEDNKALTRRAFDALNQQNWSDLYELVAPDIVFHVASTTDQGLEAYKQFLSMYLTASPDLHFTLEDKVVSRYTARGTHLGPFMGIPPTGKQAGGRESMRKSKENHDGSKERHFPGRIYQKWGMHSLPPGTYT
jgi:predicted ester cyclase